MKTRALLWLLPLSVLLLNACSKTTLRSHPEPVYSLNELRGLALYGEDDSAFYKAGRQILPQTDGSYWLLSTHRFRPATARSSELSLRRADGSILRSIPTPDNEEILAIALDADELLLLGVRDTEVRSSDFDGAYTELFLRRLSSFGQSLAESTVIDPDQSHSFSYGFQNEAHPNPPLRPGRTLFHPRPFLLPGFAYLAAHHERIYLSTAGLGGFKLFAFNARLDLLWSRELVPNSARYRPVARALPVAVTSEGAVVATELDAGEDQLFAQHFHRPLVRPPGTEGASLMRGFDRQGAATDDLTFAAPKSYFASAVAVGPQGEIWTLGNAQGPRDDDGFLIRLAPRTNAGYSWTSGLVDLREADSLSSLSIASDGNVAVAGHCGYEQAPTGSITRPSEACIARVGMDGRVISKLFFGSDRDDAILSLARGADDRIYFSGLVDGPITHTADRDPTQGYARAIFGYFLKDSF